MLERGVLAGLRLCDETPAGFHELCYRLTQLDEATPETVGFYRSLLPGAELAIIEGSAHLTMHDQPEQYVKVLREFLRRVDPSP